MIKKSSIQLKAAFLIIVFSLNTIIGFACAIGINMGFNAPHHHDEEATEIQEHEHADGKHHHEGATKHHEEGDNDHQKSKDGKDDCCNDKVIKFNEIDKSFSHSLTTVVNPVFFTTFLALFKNTHIFYTSNIISTRYFVRSYHPPIPDIRIEIQSFQI